MCHLVKEGAARGSNQTQHKVAVYGRIVAEFGAFLAALLSLHTCWECEVQRL